MNGTLHYVVANTGELLVLKEVGKRKELLELEEVGVENPYLHVYSSSLVFPTKRQAYMSAYNEAQDDLEMNEANILRAIEQRVEIINRQTNLNKLIKEEQ